MAENETQKIIGTEKDDIFTGTAGDDVIDGRGGNDDIYGGTGNDVMTGGAGADTFHHVRGDGTDVITDFDPDEDVLDISWLAPEAQKLTFTRPTKEDLWAQLESKITVATDPDNSDTVIGVQIDLSDWGGGTVVFLGLSLGDLGAENFDTWRPERTLQSGSETLDGTDGEDVLRGGLGDDDISGGKKSDYLHGGQGDDVLHGGGGKDTLIGGAGDDVLTGGRGDDTFVYRVGDGNDQITDFSSGRDKLDLSAFSNISQVSDLNAVQDGNNVVLDLSDHGGGTITLQNVSLFDMDAEDFVFFEVPTSPGSEVDGM